MNLDVRTPKGDTSRKATPRKSTSRLGRAGKTGRATTTDPDNERFDRLPGEPLGRDLLKHPVVSAVMRSRWYPGVIHIPVAAVFGLVAYELLTGPPPPMRTPARP